MAAAIMLLRQRAEPVAYTSAAVTRGDVTRVVSTSGTVNPELTIIVGSYVSGVIREQFCDYNTRVKKGQVCAKIDARPFQAAVDQAKAALATAKAQLVKDRATLAYAKISFERDAGLLARGIVSQDTVDSAKSAYGQAQAQIEVDRATVEQRAAELATAQVNLGYTDIVSPVEGTVVSRNVTIGQTVAASFQTPTLFLIATDLTKMQVDTNVSESDIGAVRQGDRATFTVEAFANRVFPGTVVQVRQAPQSVQNVVTYDVVIGVANDELLLKPGMTATTRIVTAERNDVLRVPVQALRFTPPGAPALGPVATKPASQGGTAGRVFVLDDGRPKQVRVTTGLDDDSYAEVVEGALRPGDQVVVGMRTSTSARDPAAPRLLPR
ncbi:MAG TPA: efflux RND transporter periplasmic adaptor subunit [Casimicrobiaceae bacterium]|nr:efflux RND transporter periplasmic adaptor subunit [Casimicrobiaceae bacterium]